MALNGCSSSHPIDPGPSGASAAYTSNDPIIKTSLAMVTEGKLADAQSLLASDDGHADPDVERAREEAKEIIRRTRQEYSVTADVLLKKIHKDVPDVTAADLKKWTDAGEAQARVIDGKLLYFNREPSNLYRFSKEYKERRDAAKPEKKETRWKLIDHLADVISEAEKTGETEVLPIKHRITYTLTIPANSRNVHAGSVVRVWLPFPQEYRQQKDVKLVSTSQPSTTQPSEEPIVAPNAIDGYPVGGAPQRTVYFEHRVEDPTKEMTFGEVFDYTSYAYYPILKDSAVKPLPSNWNGAYLGERAPHIVFTPELKKIVAEIIGKETNPLAKARKIYHYIDKQIAYHAENEYGVIDSFSGKALACKRGDCGVQGMLFITMCRAAGVPARWQSGWETKPLKWNMHDWAEFYVAPWGWLPADPSYGLQKSDDPKVHEFYFGHQDSYRLIVNLDYGAPLHPPKQSLRSEPADFQRGEVEIDGRNLYFNEWQYDIQMERDPGPNFKDEEE